MLKFWNINICFSALFKFVFSLSSMVTAFAKNSSGEYVDYRSALFFSFYIIRFVWVLFMNWIHFNLNDLVIFLFSFLIYFLLAVSIRKDLAKPRNKNWLSIQRLQNTLAKQIVSIYDDMNKMVINSLTDDSHCLSFAWVFILGSSIHVHVR